MAETDPSSSSSSIFSLKNNRLPDDNVFFSIFPDFSLLQSPNITSELQSLHLQVMETLSPYTSNYLWQHQPFNLSISNSNPSIPPHLHGSLRFGDNLEDEWFVVFLLFQISIHFPNLSIRVWDTDGEFLLIEAAYHLPRWINPENSTNRVFIRRGYIHIVSKSQLSSTPTLSQSLSYVIHHEDETKASDSVQLAIKDRITDYPGRAERNMHRVRVRVPMTVAQVLRYEPSLVGLAVEGFYDRDIDSMKFAAKMERFLPNGSGEEIVEVCVRMSRAMYAQLVQQTFQAPKCYPMLPSRSEGRAFVEAELGMKIACGFEMVYQLRKKEGMEGKGSKWEAYKESLERSGYFEGLLLGSKEHRRLMEKAQEYYRNSSLHFKARYLFLVLLAFI